MAKHIQLRRKRSELHDRGGITYFVGTSLYNDESFNATTITWEVGTGYQLKPGEKVRVTINLDALAMGYQITDTPPSTANGCLATPFSDAMSAILSTHAAGKAPGDIMGPGGCQQAGEVMKNEEFKITIKPPAGSILEIDRIAPAAVDTVNDLG